MRLYLKYLCAAVLLISFSIKCFEGRPLKRSLNAAKRATEILLEPPFNTLPFSKPFQAIYEEDKLKENFPAVVKLIGRKGSSKKPRKVTKFIEGEVKNIIKMGNPILRMPCDLVNSRNEEELKVIADLYATYIASRCPLSFAAPLIGAPKKIAFFRVPYDDTLRDLPPTDQPTDLTIMLNPHYIALGSGTTYGWESCPTLPNFIGDVERAYMIQYGYTNVFGRCVSSVATGLSARVIQKAIDYLDGIHYVDRLVDRKSRFGLFKEIAPYLKEGELWYHDRKNRHRDKIRDGLGLQKILPEEDLQSVLRGYE